MLMNPESIAFVAVLGPFLLFAGALVQAVAAAKTGAYTDLCGWGLVVVGAAASFLAAVSSANKDGIGLGSDAVYVGSVMLVVFAALGLIVGVVRYIRANG
jgi:hypothetical protein